MNLIRKNFFPNNLLRNSLPLLSLFYAPKKRTMLCQSLISVLFWFPSPYIYARAHSHASLCFSFPFLFHFNFPLTLSLSIPIFLCDLISLSLSRKIFSTWKRCSVTEAKLRDWSVINWNFSISRLTFFSIIYCSVLMYSIISFE